MTSDWATEIHLAGVDRLFFRCHARTCGSFHTSLPISKTAGAWMLPLISI